MSLWSPAPSLLPSFLLVLSSLRFQTGGLDREMDGEECSRITGVRALVCSWLPVLGVTLQAPSPPLWFLLGQSHSLPGKLPSLVARPALASSPLVAYYFLFWYHLEKEQMWVVRPTDRLGVLLGCVASDNSLHLSEPWFPQL